VCHSCVICFAAGTDFCLKACQLFGTSALYSQRLANSVTLSSLPVDDVVSGCPKTLLAAAAAAASVFSTDRRSRVRFHILSHLIHNYSLPCRYGCNSLLGAPFHCVRGSYRPVTKCRTDLLCIFQNMLMIMRIARGLCVQISHSLSHCSFIFEMTRSSNLDAENSLCDVFSRLAHFMFVFRRVRV